MLQEFLWFRLPRYDAAVEYVAIFLAGRMTVKQLPFSHRKRGWHCRMRRPINLLGGQKFVNLNLARNSR